MRYNLNLLIVTFILIKSNELIISAKSTSPPPPTSSSTQLPLNVTVNSTILINENHESSKKLIHPSDQFDSTINTTDQTNGTTINPPIIIHYVDFNLTENFNTSNEFYIFRNNETSNDHSINLDNGESSDNNETLIDQGQRMLNNLYNKMTHLVDYETMDTDILYNLWIPFISGFAVGLTLLLLVCCCRACCRRCPGCRKSSKINFTKGKRGSKKMQSIDDNRYLLVSNHSDSEGV